MCFMLQVITQLQERAESERKKKKREGTKTAPCPNYGVFMDG
jgi:hypothetical protein